MTVTGIILAAGRSTRMGGGPNKQFLELLGRPLVWHSLVAFENCPTITEIVLVRRPDYAAPAEAIGRQFSKVRAYADGGAERQHSVWNGLQCARGELVAVHDGARPLVTPALIDATVASARQHGTGIAATRIVDTLKEVAADQTVVRTVDRTRIWAVQTPQTVRADWLREAYRQVLEGGALVTDEAAAVERLGHPVHLVETAFWNLKVTHPHDLAVAEALLRQRGVW